MASPLFDSSEVLIPGYVACVELDQQASLLTGESHCQFRNHEDRTEELMSCKCGYHGDFWRCAAALSVLVSLYMCFDAEELWG